MKNCLFRVIALISLTASAAFAHAAESWSYEVDEDKMTSTATTFASLKSDNVLSLPFPYKDSENRGSLYVRQAIGKPVDVFVTIKRGQILCPGYGDGCEVTVRFDNDKPIRFRAIGPNDHSSTTFFIRNTGSFLSGAKKAKRILIQFTMYNAGDQTLEFNPMKSLEWNGASAKKK